MLEADGMAGECLSLLRNEKKARGAVKGRGFDDG